MPLPEEGIASKAVKAMIATNENPMKLAEELNEWFSTSDFAIRDLIYQVYVIPGGPRYSCMVIYSVPTPETRKG